MIQNGPYQVLNTSYSKHGAREFQLFPKEYFSGSDVKIYFGNQYVDEVVDIQFQLSEQVTPIYGYASYTPDAWARGARIIQGSFTVNFKESYYLFNILNNNEYAFNNSVSNKPSSVTLSNSMDDVIYMSKTMNSTNEFEKLANSYQAAIWGEETTDAMKEYIANRPYDTYFYPNGTSEKPKQVSLHNHGFNIAIVYGSAQKTAGSVYNINESVPSTVKSINGVQLTGVTQTINGQGIAIQETYTFMASDLDYNVGELYKK